MAHLRVTLKLMNVISSHVRLSDCN